MVIAKFSSMAMWSWPPGIWTVMGELQRPSFFATAAAALLLLPEARV
jgi:hypothetical protein